MLLVLYGVFKCDRIKKDILSSFWRLGMVLKNVRFFTRVVLTVLFVAFTCMPAFSEPPAEAALQRLQANAKLNGADAILADFNNGAAETRVIVTLQPSQAASALAAESVRAGQVPEEFRKPGAPTYYNLQDMSIRSRLRATVTEQVAQVINEIDSEGVTITNRFNYQFGFSAKVTPAGLEQIVNNPNVLIVEKDRLQHAHLAQGIPLMNAATARSTYDGTGISIAITDTGIDTSHPRLGGGGSPIFNSKVIGGWDTGDDDGDPRPGSSGEAHGTACAGIAGGDTGTVGDYIGGVAPGVKLYALKISTGTGGSAWDSDTIEAWDWVVTNQDADPANPIMIISHSFGGGRYYSECDGDLASLTTAAASVVSAGITMFASSGNDGYCDSMGGPACISYINSVGAVYDADIGGWGFCVDSASCAVKEANAGCSTGWVAWDTIKSPDMVTGYSNSTSSLTMFAPSNSAHTADITGIGGYNTALSPAGDYTSDEPGFGGTSAACPYAAGSAAVLQSAAKTRYGSYLTPTQVNDYLVNNGDNITDSKPSGITKPRVNLGNAVNALPPILTVNKNGSGSGTVTSSPAGIDCGATCSQSFDIDTIVTLTASAGFESTFTDWSGEGCSGTGTCVVTMDADRTVTAEFTINTYTLDVTTSGTGSGTVTSDPAGITCGGVCTEDYDYSTLVTLTATQDTGSTFSGWTGESCSGTGTCIVTMDQARSVDAEFTLNTYDLTVTLDGSGTDSVTSDIPGINCGVDCSETYDYNTVVILTAAADPGGSSFVEWIGGGCSGTGTCTVTMDQHQSVTARFLINPQSLTIAKSGNGTGTVTSSPSGILCGSDCAEFYTYDEVVTLTASPDSNSTFNGWSETGCPGTGTCDVTMDQARSVTATFALDRHKLNVAGIGTGSGVVTSSPAGIECGTDCTETFDTGTNITLTAAPGIWSSFVGWSGDYAGPDTTCALIMDQAKSVNAEFTKVFPWPMFLPSITNNAPE